MLRLPQRFCTCLLEHFSAKLPVSRLQRDLTDSTVLRNIGVPVAHTILAIKSIEKGLCKLVLNERKLYDDLESNWAVVAEANRANRDVWHSCAEAKFGFGVAGARSCATGCIRSFFPARWRGAIFWNQSDSANARGFSRFANSARGSKPATQERHKFCGAAASDHEGGQFSRCSNPRIC